MEIEDLDICDGKVTKIVIAMGQATFHAEKWNGEPLTVTFDDVVSITGLGAQRDDIDRIESEQVEGGTLFRFVSGWNEARSLEIVAARAVVDATDTPGSQAGRAADDWEGM